MKRGLDWYKREQRSILDAIRAARMTDRQAAIYNIVIDLIYEGGGETPDDPKHIASYLSNVGQAAARTTIQQLIDMGKIFRVGEMLHQKRAENEAQTRENLSETRAKTGRLGGISSGKSRRERRENNNLAEANASSKTEAEKRREREDTGRGVARAREDNSPQPPPDPPQSEDLIWRILHGLGFDRGQVIPKFWMAPDAPLIVERWRSTVGLSDDEIVRVATRNAAQHGEPARGPKVLTPAMEAYAAAKAAQTLQPEPKPRGAGHDRRSERQAFDATIAAVADGLSAGTINLETASRDPFAERSGGDAVAGQRGAGALLRPG